MTGSEHDAGKNGTAPGKTKPAEGAEPQLDPSMQAHIGAQLRALYEKLVDEPVPDRFLKLLEDLERKPPPDTETSGH